MSKRLFAAILSALVVGSLALAGCGPKVQDSKPAASGSPGGATATPAAKPVIPIGMAIDLSAGTASYGQAALQAAQLAVDEANPAGGVNGSKIKLIPYDDNADPQKSQELITRLISEDKVVAIIGPANSGNAKQHIPIVQKAEIPDVIPVATAVPLTLTFQDQPKNYIFRISMVDSGQVSVMLRWAQAKGYKKLGILHDTTGYGNFGRDEVKAQAAKFGIEVASVASFQQRDSNMEPQLNQMRDAKVDAVIVYCLAPDMSQVLKSADKINYKGPFVGSWAGGDPLIKSLAGDLIGNGNFFFVQSFTADQSPAAAGFDKKMRDKYGDKYIFPVAASQTYDTVNLIVAALKKSGPDPKALRDAIENFDGFQAVTAAPAHPFTAKNHEAINGDVMFMATWKDGKIVKAP